MKIKKIFIAGLTLLSLTAAEAQTIEERLAILEQKLETEQEAASNFSLKVSGYLQADYRDYLRDEGSTQFADQFYIRRARTAVSGTVHKHTDYRVMIDLANGGGTTPGPTSNLLQDAYVELKGIPWARLRLGKFKLPLGLERYQSDSSLAFVERALPANLVPGRDTGAQLSGEWKEGLLSYHAGVFNGVVDGGNGETDTHDGKDYVGRLFSQPFKKSSSEWINGFGLGIAGSVGDQFGSATTSNLPSAYRTESLQTFFTYQSGTFADGTRKRINPQASWYLSRVGLLGEYIASSQEVTRVNVSTRTANLTHRSWQLAGSFVLTGERPSFDGLKPRKSFDPKHGGWGAFEIVGRYATFRADDASFDNGGFFASPATSAKKARSWATGFNWYLNSNLKVVSNYNVTSFLGGATTGNRPTERVILNRVQVSF
jgi:phosphate-selective porin OprO and OprP